MSGIDRLTVVALLLVSTLALNCANHSELQTPPKAPSALPSSKLLPEYKLGYGDVVDIKFFRNPEFNETLVVRPDGRISLPKVGEMHAAGMTPAELDSIITQTYSEFVIEPDVTVIVREFGGYQVYVLGEVESPGGYPVQRDMTVLQALAMAGGAQISAKLGSVMVLRRSQGEEIEALKLNLRKPVEAKQQGDIAQNDIYVQPRDIVFVPKTFVASASDFMRQVYAGFMPPLDLYLRAVLFYDR